FHQVNAGKLSVELDLGADEDRARVADLAAGADVLVENMRPGVLERHGLGYEALSDLNPSLVMLSMSLAGQQGPLRGAKGYASIMSALSGLESLVGYSPQDITGMLTVAVGDPNAATYGVLCVLGALLERERTGRGAWLDLSQLEAAACGLLGTLAAFAEHGPGVWAYGNWHARHAPHGSYPTRDGWVSLSVGDDEQWRGLLDALAIPADAALRNASLAGNAGRLRRREELNDGMARATASFERENLLERLSAAGVAAAPALELNDRSVAGFVAAPRHAMPMAHPYGGEEVLVTPPWDIDGAQPQFARRAPLLGEHTEEVLASGWPAA
ncbi:MAG TPA: CoA transferase, partial [Solirubrobacteraceae bacterium]|nr:CoA transferase [Solirubrobacteraceae bacterium]